MMIRAVLGAEGRGESINSLSSLALPVFNMGATRSTHVVHCDTTSLKCMTNLRARLIRQGTNIFVKASTVQQPFTTIQ